MKRSLPAYCYERRRKSGVYIYYERKGQKGVLLRSTPGTQEFAREYARVLSGIDTTPSGKRTFSGLIKQYKASQKFARLAVRTKADYTKHLAFIDERLGALPVAGMQRKDVIRLRDSNADRVREANYLVQITRILHEYAIDIGWRTDNPAKGVELLKSTKPKREAWPDDMVKAYRATASGRAKLIFELCIGTGQRIGDVLRMRWNDLQDGGIHVRQGKTGAKLWIPLTGALRATLDATPRKGLTIAAQTNGLPTSYRGAADLVMAVRRQIGAEAYDLHGLRYTTTRELAEAGCSDDLIKSVTGHATGAMVHLYAAAARQKTRAVEAQGKRK